jgi:hypothetical protein
MSKISNAAFYVQEDMKSQSGAIMPLRLGGIQAIMSFFLCNINFNFDTKTRSDNPQTLTIFRITVSIDSTTLFIIQKKNYD